MRIIHIRAVGHTPAAAPGVNAVTVPAPEAVPPKTARRRETPQRKSLGFSPPLTLRDIPVILPLFLSDVKTTLYREEALLMDTTTLPISISGIALLVSVVSLAATICRPTTDPAHLYCSTRSKRL